MPTRYPGDPYWLTARFNSTCPGCQKPIKKGEEIFYYPRERKAFCADPCGRKASAEFESAAADEDFYAAQY